MRKLGTTAKREARAPADAGRTRSADAPHPVETEPLTESAAMHGIGIGLVPFSTRRRDHGAS